MTLKRNSQAGRVRKYALMQQRPFTSVQCAEATGAHAATARNRLNDMVREGSLKLVEGYNVRAYISSRPKLISPSAASGEHRWRNETSLQVWRALESGLDTATSIAEAIGKSRQTVHKYLCALRSLGHITGKTHYELNAEYPPDLDTLASYPKIEDIIRGEL